MFLYLGMRNLKNIANSYFNSLLVICFLSFCSTFAVSQTISFANVAPVLGINYAYGICSFGGGLSLCDFNGDGKDDLSFGSCVGSSPYLFQNSNLLFLNMTPGVLLADTMSSRCLLWADYDNDGDRDLFVTHDYGPPLLFRNDGNNTFSDVTNPAGISTDPIFSYSAVWADYDLDGFLDIYVVNRNSAFIDRGPNYLFHNNGNGTFSDATFAAGLLDSTEFTFQAAFFDYDNDAYPDLYLANDKAFSPNVLYHNNGDGTFTDVTDSATTGVAIDAMGLAIGDYNNDGFLDIFVTNTPFTGVGNILLRNNGNGTFSIVSDTLGVKGSRISWGANFVDFDNDRDEDLHVCTGSMGMPVSPKNHYYENLGNGTFLEDSLIAFASDSLQSFGSAVGDINEDGFYDLAIMNATPTDLAYFQNSGNANHWIKLRLVGTLSNKDAIGTWIETWVGGSKRVRYTMCGVSFGSQNSHDEIFGLGAALQADSVILRWPSGFVNKLIQPMGDQLYTIVEDTGQVLLSVNSAGSVFGNDPDQEKLIIWPNPASSIGLVHLFIGKLDQAGNPAQAVELKEPLKLSVYDLAGRRLIHKEINVATCQLSTEGLKPGLYFVEITNTERKVLHSNRLVARLQILN